ncbi:MAG: primosomal protein N' [Lachnospiraceae bacterium]|nr:primosomal protein N' [Lachnospiraceae bacterium]
MPKYADVILEISHEKLDRPFQYRIPGALEERAVPGAKVRIPFGKGNREILGYIVDVTDRRDVDEDKLKDLLDVVASEEEFGPEQQLISLAAWMKRHYGGTLIRSLKTVLPAGKAVPERQRKVVCLSLSPAEARSQAEIFLRKHQTARARLLSALADCPEIDFSLLRDKLQISLSVVKALSEKGMVSLISTVEYRNPDIKTPSQKAPVSLSLEQERIVDSFRQDYGLGIRNTTLIHGVTGSGKTEVYMEIIATVLQEGRQAIVLIPEIALTFQTVMRFYARFGNRVSYLHSKLSQGERSDQYRKARRGELDIMIGPRSALFTPFPSLGVIIIDEEHEGSYKAENMPKYHTRETAIERARLSGASVVLGSATPSVDAYYRAKRGEYRLYELNERVKGGMLPRVHVVDLREELKKGNRSIFSNKLKTLIGDRLQRKEQTMIFLNRRGYAGFVNCRKCGFVMKCPHCDVALSAHRDGTLQCHYCGYRTRSGKKCPECGSSYFGGMRAGTEQVEDNVKKLFPMASVLRMDADTTKKKEDYDKILAAFSDGQADILVGTQMIVKGHDFPNVTLVGILAADLSLYAGDYRSGERTFDLLTQAAGRAGRAEKPGEVVIQTYSPDHYSIAAASRQDYNSFYKEEIGFRSLMNYPPVSHLLKVLIEGPVDEKAGQMADIIARLTKTFSDAVTVGPAPDSIAKLKDSYRYTVYVKHADYERLAEIKDAIEKWRRENPVGRTTVLFDFDPI